MRRTLSALTVVAAACASAPHDGGSTLPVPAGVRANMQTAWYDVDGTDPRSWSASMRARAPEAGVMPGSTAQTTWMTRWSYPGTRRTATGCAPVDPVVEVEVRMILPRLRSDSGVAPEALAEWRRFSAALRTHENGHALRGLRAAQLQRDLLRRAEAPTCDALGSQLRVALQEVAARYQASDREYDAASRHGIRQGTTLGRASPDTSYHDVVP